MGSWTRSNEEKVEIFAGIVIKYSDKHDNTLEQYITTLRNSAVAGIHSPKEVED